MANNKKNFFKFSLIFTVIIIGYVFILSFISWLFRKGIEYNNIVMLVAGSVLFVVHSFFFYLVKL